MRQTEAYTRAQQEQTDAYTRARQTLLWSIVQNKHSLALAQSLARARALFLAHARALALAFI